jgi:hypothetical protein
VSLQQTKRIFARRLKAGKTDRRVPGVNLDDAPKAPMLRNVRLPTAVPRALMRQTTSSNRGHWC